MKHEQTGYWRSCSNVRPLLAVRRRGGGTVAALAALLLRRLAAATVLLLCLWGSVHAAPPMQPLLTDDFNDGNDNGWTQINRSWHVIDGRYHLDGCYGCNDVPLTGGRDGFSYTHVDDPTWTDYTFEFTFDTTNAPSADNPDWEGTAFAHHAMVFFRVQGPLPGPGGAPTQYRADFCVPCEPASGEHVTLSKYVNGPGTTLVDTATSGVILLGTNTGKIIVSGGHIQIFVNNQLVIDFTDPDPISFGGIGLSAIWGVNAWFDNVSVTPPPPTVTCAGLPATIVGTNGPDILVGTSGPDVIHGLDDNDGIDGRGGDDVICGGAGDDILLGGEGDDRLFGGPGARGMISSVVGRETTSSAAVRATTGC